MLFNELKWVEFLKKKTGKNNVSSLIGDDCAVVSAGKEKLLLSSDLFIEGVHFKKGRISYKILGERAVARAISDIAACGGRPKFIGVSLGMPSYLKEKQLKDIFSGVMASVKACGAVLAGGDTAKSKQLFLDVWVVGEAEKAILRSTAKAGDYIFVTGRLGALKFNKPFRPRIKEALYLSGNFNINSMIDISDGFIIDLYRVLKESNKGALVFKDKIPVTGGFSDVYRGEDYELIFTVDKSEKKLAQLMKKFNCVGKVKSRKFGYYIGHRGKKKKAVIKGYLHF